MARDESVPGFAELSDWPFTPRPPVRIADYGWYRDGGPQGGTFYVDLEDAEGRRIPFFFERFLGRLCYGSAYETGDDAAFLKKGSRVQSEAFAIIGELAASSPEYAVVAERLERSRRWL